ALQGDGGSGRERAGDLNDIAELVMAGRGPVNELAAAVRRGGYRSAPRDDDEMDHAQPELLTPEEASSYLSGKHRIQNSRLTLANRRCAGTGPEFHRRGRSIFYTHAA